VRKLRLKLHVLLDGAKTRKDKASRVTAEAQRMLSFYNLRLMTEDPFDRNPQAQTSPTRTTPFVFEEPAEEEEPESKQEPEEPEEETVKKNVSQVTRRTIIRRRQHEPSNSSN